MHLVEGERFFVDNGLDDANIRNEARRLLVNEFVYKYSYLWIDLRMSNAIEICNGSVPKILPLSVF